MSSTEINNTIINYLNPYQPNMIGIFGSYARGENKTGSDMDLLIDLKKTISLLDLVRIEMDLSEMLGIKIDLVTKRALKNKTLINYIQKDLKIIYER